MKAKYTLTITEARRTIFDVSSALQKKVPYYTLTEFGKPKVVMLSAEMFERMLERAKEADNLRAAGISGHGAGMLSDGGVRYGMQDWDTAMLPTPVPWIVVRDALRGVGDYHHERELIKAQLYVELVDQYGYPVRTIDIGKYVRLGSERSKKFLEVDLIVNDEDGKTRMAFTALPHEVPAKDLDAAMEELFEVAREIPWSSGGPNLLICFTRHVANKKREEKVVAVDYEKYKSFTAWKKSGMPTSDSIPKYKMDESGK